jgi:hypothetical protein
MDYYTKNINKDGVLRMLMDGSTFNNIDEIWPHFKDEPHNIRISLAVDGVNPFGELKSTYSVWPVFVINNNIPPWMSIKREHIMLAMIVPSICLEYIFLTW